MLLPLYAPEVGSARSLFSDASPCNHHHTRLPGRRSLAQSRYARQLVAELRRHVPPRGVVNGLLAGAVVSVLLLGLLASLALAHVILAKHARQRRDARSRVRAVLAALPGQLADAGEVDLTWWLTHAEALSAELRTTPVAGAARGGLERVSSAAAREVLQLLDGVPYRGFGARARLKRATLLVGIAPTPEAGAALLALQADGDPALDCFASAVLARHPDAFASASAPLAFFISRLRLDRALAARWALGRILRSDGRRAAVYLEDPAPGVRRAVLAHLGRDALVAGAVERGAGLAASALACAADADAGVRTAAFAALPRLGVAVPSAVLSRGLADASDAVRAKACGALPYVEGDPLALLPALDETDASLGRAARLLLRASARRSTTDTAPHPTSHQQRHEYFERLTAVPTQSAELALVASLTDADAGLRRHAARALAALARTVGSSLQERSVDALLAQLETDRARGVRAALIEALETSGDPRVAERFSDLATRTRDPVMRLRLAEASALARHVRKAVDRRTGTDLRREPAE